MMLLFVQQAFGQDDQAQKQDEEFEPVHVILYKYKKKEWYKGDSIEVIQLPELVIYDKPIQFKSARQRQKFDRLVYNVKKVLPIAKQAKLMLCETYETLERIPDPKEKAAHMRAVEKSIKKQYTPQMKKLTYSQGKLLIKLIDRECHQSSYDVIKAFLGPAKATFYQVFAWTFRASLKKKYDPEDDDAMVERVVQQVELGLL